MNIYGYDLSIIIYYFITYAYLSSPSFLLFMKPYRYLIGYR